MKFKHTIAKWLVKWARKLNPESVPIMPPRPIIELPLSSAHIRLIQIDRKFDRADGFRFSCDDGQKYMIQCVRRDLADAIANSDIIYWSVADGEGGCIRVRARLYVTNYAQTIDKETQDNVYQVINSNTFQKT